MSSHDVSRAVRLGLIVPLPIAVIQQCQFGKRTRKLVAAATSLAVGWLAGKQDRVVSAVLTMVVAEVAHRLAYEPTGITQAVERATTVNISGGTFNSGGGQQVFGGSALDKREETIRRIAGE